MFDSLLSVLGLVPALPDVFGIGVRVAIALKVTVWCAVGSCWMELTATLPATATGRRVAGARKAASKRKRRRAPAAKKRARRDG